MAYHPWTAVDLIELGFVKPEDFDWTHEQFLKNKKERDDYYRGCDGTADIGGLNPPAK
jgi:hypothetical protein